MDYLKTSQFYPITTICLVSVLLSFVSVPLSTYLGIALAFWLVMRGRPDGLLGLFLLYFIRYYFFYDLNSFSINLEGVADEFRDTVVVSGFPVNVETVVCGYICLRVFYEKLCYPKSYLSEIPTVIFWLWIIAFIPVVIGFYLGFQTRNPNWTRGLRFLMIIGSYFYGFIIVKKWPSADSRILYSMLLPFVVVMLILMNFRIYWSHHGFLFLGIGGAFSVYFFRSSRFNNRLFGLLLLFLTCWYAVLGSFTTLFIALVSILLAYMGTRNRPLLICGFLACACGKKPKSFKHFVKLTGTLAILAILCFSICIGVLGYYLELDHSHASLYYAGTVSQRFQGKLFFDRLPFWHAALKQIVTNPYFIVPSGQPLQLNIPGLPEVWTVGAHNSALEVVRLNGLFAGSIMLLILFYALKKLLSVLTKSKDLILTCLAAALLGTAVVGMTMGDFPVDQTVGVWLWSLASVCYGLFLRTHHEERPKLSLSQKSDSLELET